VFVVLPQRLHWATWKSASFAFALHARFRSKLDFPQFSGAWPSAHNPEDSVIGDGAP